MNKEVDFKDYDKFAEGVYGESYFTGSIGPKRANYVAGFGGSWYTQVFAWLKSAINFRDKAILDGGCAVGAFVREFLTESITVYGVDVSDFAINKAKNNCPTARFNRALLSNTGHKGNSFDIFFTMETIEHMHPEQNKQFADEAFRILKSGGILFMQGQMPKTMKGFVPAEDDDPGHINYQSQGYWFRLLQEVGLERAKEIEALLKTNETAFISEMGWTYFVFQKPVETKE